MTEWDSLMGKNATGTTSTTHAANFELVKVIECDKYEILYMWRGQINLSDIDDFAPSVSCLLAMSVITSLSVITAREAFKNPSYGKIPLRGFR